MPVAAAGSYNVMFEDETHTYPEQWYNGRFSEATANPVTVTARETTSGINAALASPTHITGMVTDASSTPLANVCVYLYHSGPTGGRTTDKGVCTNSVGQYTMPVMAAGSYNVVFEDSTGTYPYEWYNGQFSEATANPVAVTAGATTSGVNATLVQPPGQITGTVTSASSTPLANVCAYLYASGPTGGRTTDKGVCTNSAGQYTMPVAAAGSYNVVFEDSTGTYPYQWYHGQTSEATANAVTVTAGATTSGVNATLTLPSTAITGTVTNGSSAPLANVCVYLYHSGPTGGRTSDKGVCTNSAGRYTMPVAAAGSYNVVFEDSTGTYPYQWYNGQTSEATASPVTVTAGATTSGVNATLGAG
jgi:protocatechuate 3,4-dioxygenase beta subunit